MATIREIASLPAAEVPARTFDVRKIREDFPILKQKMHGKPLIYLDNAATSQKPQVVIDALLRFYLQDCANIHRGVYLLSERSTQAYEDSRVTIQKFMNAAEPREIVYVRGATEGINLVAQTYGRQHIGPGDEVLITAMEHHSNIVPWQILCEEKGARLRVGPINDRGELILNEFEKLLNDRTRMVSVAHVSNALGTINPVKQIVEMAHSRKIPVLIDGAQAAPHMKVDVRALGCDFYAISGHKLFGPTGIGALYGKADLLESMPPYQGGGDMILSVTFEKTTYNHIPHKFEAGTPNIAAAIAWGPALDYVSRIGMENIASYEHALLTYATEAIGQIPGVRLIGTAREKAGVLSFVVDGVHPHDVGTVLDQEGIAVRTGHHCAQPVMERFGVPATVRASLAFYNTKQEINALAAGLERAKAMFA
jgi:cysteine desulfurase/selenocysteine lyase